MLVNSPATEAAMAWGVAHMLYFTRCSDSHPCSLYLENVMRCVCFCVQVTLSIVR